MTHTITQDELRAAIEAGTVTVVETLRPEHFAQGHIPGAVHLHMEDVAAKAAVLLPDKDAAIVTYCSNEACGNSQAVANRLERLGYSNVRKYRGGIQDWAEAGNAIEQTTAA